MVGAAACVAMSQATDLMLDLKTGYPVQIVVPVDLQVVVHLLKALSPEPLSLLNVRSMIKIQTL